jgi:hypothetical protein
MRLTHCYIFDRERTLCRRHGRAVSNLKPTGMAAATPFCFKQKFNSMLKCTQNGSSDQIKLSNNLKLSSISFGKSIGKKFTMSLES